MKTIFKLFLGGVATAGVLYVIKKASTYQSIKEKFKFFVGTPRIHNYKDGFVNVAISGTKITNQSNLQLNIEKLYTTVQYLNPATNRYTDLMVQNNSTNNIAINPYSLNTVPDIMLNMPISNLGVIKDMLLGKTSSTVKVLTRFQISGVEVPAIENMIDFKSIVSGAAGLIPGLNLLSSNDTADGLINKLKSLFGTDGMQNTDSVLQNGSTSNHSYLSLVN